MKSALFAIFLAVVPAGWAATLSDAKTLYVLPMGSALDQYLANRLANSRLVQIVADPKLADAVLTDRLGETLERHLDDIAKARAKAQPAPTAAPKAEPKPGTAAKQDPGAKPDAAKVEDESAEEQTSAGDEPAVQPPPVPSTFGRAKGTLFLVHVETREVLWSTYLEPADKSSKSLDKAAGQVVDRLIKAVSGKN